MKHFRHVLHYKRSMSKFPTIHSEFGFIFLLVNGCNQAGRLSWFLTHPWPSPVQFLPWLQDGDSNSHPHRWPLETFGSRWISVAVITTSSSRVQHGQLWPYDPPSCSRKSSEDCFAMDFLFSSWVGTSYSFARPIFFSEVTGIPLSDIFGLPALIPYIWPSMEDVLIGLARALWPYCIMPPGFKQNEL